MLKRDALSRFAASGEKSAPPVFVGRKETLTTVIKKATSGWGNMAQGEPGNTLIIQGAPGAGKSSIIAELKKRLNKHQREGRHWARGEPRILELDPIDIINLDLGLGQLARFVSRKHANTLVVRTTDMSGVELGADLKVIGGKRNESKTSENVT